MDDFRRCVEEVKEKADLLQVMEESGAEFAFERGRRGKYIYCKAHPALAIDETRGTYTWFSHAGTSGHEFETGDVFDWLERRRGMDFWAALTHLADRYGVKTPDTRTEDQGQRAKAYQARGELYTLAHEWLVKQLWSTPAALDYCRRVDGGRAWLDETICHRVTAEKAQAPGGPYIFQTETLARAKDAAATTVVAEGAGLGFSPGTREAAKDLQSLLETNGVDLRAPAAVAIIGMEHGVRAWAEGRGIDPQSNWLEHDRIYGLVDFPRLIYPHVGRGGKPVYFSARNLKWDGDRLIGETDKKRKAYNPPEALVGERMLYFNWLFHKRVPEVVMVEGQADAITLGEWGIPAIALNGISAGPELVAIVRDVRKRFLALDADRAGQAAMLELGQVLGPTVRMMNWNTDKLSPPAANDDDEGDNDATA
jgi:hypothetical protein